MTDTTVHEIAASTLSNAAQASASNVALNKANDPMYAAAQEFEALFLAQMLDNMFTGMESDPLFGGGAEEESYRGLLNAQYARAVSRAGGVGVADAVYREILKLQEAERQ